MLKYLEKALQLNEFTSFTPFEWDSERKLPVLSSNLQRHIKWYFNIAVTLTNFIFVTVRCMQVHRKGNSMEAGRAMRIHMIFMVIFFAFPTLLQIFTATICHSFPTVVKNYMRFLRKYEGECRLFVVKTLCLSY